MGNEGYTYGEWIGAAAAGRGVLDWLSERYPHASAAVWETRIDGGEVLLDGAPALPRQILRAGQRLEWKRPPWLEPEVPLHFELLHEDAHVIAVAKPSGLPTQPAGGFHAHTLQALVQARFPGADPLHRLGRGTSGIVLFARSPEARSQLSRALREGGMLKVYRTLAGGQPPWDERRIEVPIGPVPHPMLGTLHAASPEGRPARSHAFVIERRAEETLLDVRIETGRPHQIRIHLAAVGHPLVGDPLYRVGGVPAPDALPGDEGYLLHAMTLGFPHPATGWFELHAPPPAALRPRR